MRIMDEMSRMMTKFMFGPLSLSFVNWSVELLVPYVGKSFKQIRNSRPRQSHFQEILIRSSMRFSTCAVASGQDSQDSALIDSHQELTAPGIDSSRN
jgi:hypothetical protein